MTKDKLISVIIPGYNEELLVKKTIEIVMKEFRSLKRPFDVTIVNDNSSDKTLEIIQKIIKWLIL